MLKDRRSDQIHSIARAVRGSNTFTPILLHRRKVVKYLQEVDEREQPFGRVLDIMQEYHRTRGATTTLDDQVDILQVRNRILATVLLLRCDFAILASFLQVWKMSTVNHSTLQMKLS